jgi:hypothetical protein
MTLTHPRFVYAWWVPSGWWMTTSEANAHISITVEMRAALSLLDPRIQHSPPDGLQFLIATTQNPDQLINRNTGASPKAHSAIPLIGHLKNDYPKHAIAWPVSAYVSQLSPADVNKNGLVKALSYFKHKTFATSRQGDSKPKNACHCHHNCRFANPNLSARPKRKPQKGLPDLGRESIC